MPDLASCSKFLVREEFRRDVLAKPLDLVEKIVHVRKITLLTFDRQPEHVREVLALDGLRAWQRVRLDQNGAMLLLSLQQVLVNEVFGLISPLVRVLHVIWRGVPEADICRHRLVGHFEVRPSLDLLSHVSGVFERSISDFAHAFDAVLLQEHVELDAIGASTTRYGPITDVILGHRIVEEQVGGSGLECLSEQALVIIYK